MYILYQRDQAKKYSSLSSHSGGTRPERSQDWGSSSSRAEWMRSDHDDDQPLDWVTREPVWLVRSRFYWCKAEVLIVPMLTCQQRHKAEATRSHVTGFLTAVIRLTCQRISVSWGLECFSWKLQGVLSNCIGDRATYSTAVWCSGWVCHV